MNDPYREASDNELYRRFSSGDTAAYTVLVDRHTDRFYGLAWRMCGQDQEAEDIVQDAFLKLWQNPKLFNPDKGSKFTTWFYRVVVNLSYDAGRKKKPQAAPEVLDFMADDAEATDEAIARKQVKTEVEIAIQSLPERQRTALNLCFYEDLSNAEAAEIMGVGIKALESLLMRAKKGLKDILLREQRAKEAING